MSSSYGLLLSNRIISLHMNFAWVIPQVFTAASAFTLAQSIALWEISTPVKEAQGESRTLALFSDFYMTGDTNDFI